MARSLSSKPNVVAPGGAYPYGRIKDNPGDGSGTPVNEEVYGDFHQFFERLLNEGGVSANELPENNTNSFQYVTALINVATNIANTAAALRVAKSGDTMTGILTNTAGFRTNAGQPAMLEKVLTIGDWDMNNISGVAVIHGLALNQYKKIRSISVIIRGDGDVTYYDFLMKDGGYIGSFNDTEISLERINIANGGVFDNVSFDSTSFNRGWVTIRYEA